MPSAKALEQKKAIVSELSEKLKSACAGVVVSYQGINVDDDTKLRKELRESGVEYMVTKNTLLKRAAEDAKMEELSDVFKGSTAIAVCNDDYVAASKILCKFAKDHDFFKIKSGFIDESVIDAKEVTRLAKLPSREVLIAQVLSGLNAPIAGLVGTLNGTITGLVAALNAIAQKKQNS
ncbi:MAG: 50S ribosomal protein L10 [Clostridia bacterium]|nr:50S ribosomal protein L10 [Clostridia bacterium]